MIGKSVLPMPREYPPMPYCKPYQKKSMTCDTCIKSDVCGIRDELMRAVKDIDTIAGRTNVFIEADVKCKRYAEAEVKNKLYVDESHK